jgi:hypothetical protein
MDKKTTFIFVVFVIVALVIGFLAGQWQGGKQGEERASEKFQPIVDAVFPEPPVFVGTLTGAIKGISGATIALEINDLDDFLPHLDGSPRKTEVRFAVVTPDTKLFSISSQTGISTTIAPKDLKIGDTITITSAENIRNAERFDAAEVRIVK